MPLRLAPIAPVLAGTLLAQIALGALTPLIPLLLLSQGEPSTAIGAIASAYFVGFLCGAATTYRVVIRVGHIRAFAVFAVVSADAAALMAVTHNPWIWALLRWLIGFHIAGVFTVVESWLNDKADTTTRGRVFGAYMLASWVGAAVGPLTLSVVAVSPVMFVAVGFALTTSLLPMALTHVANPMIGPKRQIGIRRLYRISPLGVICCMTSGLVNSTFYALVPVFLTKLDYGTHIVAQFSSGATIAGFVAQYPIGMLSDRFGRRQVTVAVLLLGLCFAALMALGGFLPLAFLMTVSFLMAGMAAPLYGLGAGQVNDRLERGDFIAASSGLLFIWALGASIGPSAAGALMSAVGPYGLVVYLVVILALVAGFAFFRMRARIDIPRDQQSSFVTAPTTQSPTGLAHLDPRATPTAEEAPPAPELPSTDFEAEPPPSTEAETEPSQA
jgi:MFS family permease